MPEDKVQQTKLRDSDTNVSDSQTSLSPTESKLTIEGSKDKNIAEPHHTQALLVVISELCFVILPFIVYLLVLNYQQRLSKVFTLSEWAFAAVLLLGQALARFFTLLMSGRKPKISGKPLIVFVLTLVFGLIPSVIVLVFVLLSSEATVGAQTPSNEWFPNLWSKLQLFYFAVAVVVYFVLVGAHEYENSRERHQSNNKLQPADSASGPSSNQPIKEVKRI
ncbi:MAG: hypothetical protein AABN34_16895 [Acidobacteriota bacterium]